MTIAEDDPLVNTYVGNGVTSTFDFHFKITASDELNVIIVGVAFLELGTDYTVDGVGVNGGGSITLVDGPLADGAEIRIYDWVQPSQLVPFANQGAFRGYQHENAFDKVTRAVKRALGYATRSLTLAEDTPWYINRTLPDPVPGGYYRWDQDGLNMEISAITGYTDIGTTPGTVAAGNDARFDTVPAGDYPVITGLGGGEYVVLLDGEDGALATVDDVAGNPIDAQLGRGRDSNKCFTNFSKLPKDLFLGDGTSGTIAGLEPFRCYASGANSGVVNLQVLTQVGAITLSSGTTTTCRAAIEHMEYPILYNPVSFDRKCVATFSLGTDKPTGGNDAWVQYGFIDSAPEVVIFGSGLGVFFEATAANANWQARWVSHTAGAANNRSVDTGVAVGTETLHAFEIRLQASQTVRANRKAFFYIDGVLVATILHSDTGVTVMPTNTRLSMALVVKKSSGTTAIAATMTNHYSDNGRAALPVGFA